MSDVKIAAQPREEQGKGPAGRLRRDGLVPGVVYGEGREARMVQINAHDFEQVLRKHSGEHMLVELSIKGDSPRQVLIQEVQHHPVSGKVLHVDFNEVSMTERLSVEVPIELVGDPVGVTKQGGVLEHILRELEVECLPTDILERVEVDVSAMEIGDSLTVADIQLDSEKYEILSDSEYAIAAVAAPRVEEEEEEEEEVEAEGAEPEVIGEKKEEGEEGEEAEEKE